MHRDVPLLPEARRGRELQPALHLDRPWPLDGRLQGSTSFPDVPSRSGGLTPYIYSD